MQAVLTMMRQRVLSTHVNTTELEGIGHKMGTQTLLSRRYIFIAVMMTVVILLGAAWPGHTPSAQAQQTNLLVNGGMEQPYYGQGAANRTVPNGWTLWVGEGAPVAFPHTDPLQVRDGSASWNINQGFGKFTAAGYQRVGGLTDGEVVKLTGYGWVYTCNDTTTSCIIAEAPYRRSDSTAGAQLKVGIDPTGGIDPNSPNVVWSAAAAPYDQWAEMTVNAQVKGTEVTVFLWATQQYGMALNNVYWDQISLVRTTEAASGAAAAGQAPGEAFAPFVVPQSVRPDGSIVHRVQAGDTLTSIVYAYSNYGVTIDSVVALNSNIRPNTRFLQIGQEIVILPPGSVDPVTGELRPAGSAQPVVPTQAPAPTPTPQAVAETAPLPPAGETAPAQEPVAIAPPPIYSPVQAAFVPFEKGYMLWLGDTRQIYVMVQNEGQPAGTFTTYQDTWREGMPESDSTLTAPEGLFQPERNFGHAWRTYPGVRDSLGWATGPALRYTALLIRDSGKVILNGPEGVVFTLENGAWTVTDLYAEETDNQG